MQTYYLPGVILNKSLSTFRKRLKLAIAIVVLSVFQLQAQTFTVTKADDTDDGVCDAAD